MDNHAQSQSETQIIAELFGKLRAAETQSGPRDAAAEDQINAALRQQPAAPYYMAQALVVQEQALIHLQQRIEDLEHELAQRPASGGFLAGLFGAPKAAPEPRAAAATQRSLTNNNGLGANLSALDSRSGQAQRGGFLGSAVQTAVAVAGGVLLANVLTNMFAGNSAEAAELPADAWPDSDTDSGFNASSNAQDDYAGGDDDGGGFDDY